MKNRRWPLLRLYPGIGLLLVFLGPYFFFQSLSYLSKLNYTGGVIGFLAGWALLRAGIDLTRAYLAVAHDPLEVTHQTGSPLPGSKDEG